MTETTTTTNKIDQLTKLKCDYNKIIDTIKEHEKVIEELEMKVEPLETDISIIEIAAAYNKIKRLYPDDISDNICHVCKSKSYHKKTSTPCYKCPNGHTWSYVYHNKDYVRVGYKPVVTNDESIEYVYEYDECDII